MIPIEPIVDGASELAQLDALRQLSFVVVLMGIAAVIVAVAFLVIEWKRGNQSKEDRESNQRLLTEMVGAMKQSAQAQADAANAQRDTAAIQDDIKDFHATIKQNTQHIGDNATAIRDLTANIGRLVENDKRAGIAATDMLQSLSGLKTELSLMAADNKERLDAMEKVVAEIGESYGKGVGFVEQIEGSLKGIKITLDRMDSQFQLLVNRIDHALQSAEGKPT